MESVLERVQKAFNSTFELDGRPITLDTAPGDISAWDSMGHVALASGLEQEFKVTFDVDELMAMENVREIVKILNGKLGAT
jgi:acyl carrier protein